MATPQELLAGVNVANAKLHKWFETLLPDHYIPFVGNIREIAKEKLDSPEGKQLLHEEVSDILLAAEHVRSSS